MYQGIVENTTINFKEYRIKVIKAILQEDRNCDRVVSIETVAATRVRRRGWSMEHTKCSVCGGWIVNGRCQDCGMYYPSETGRYYLNEMREKQYSVSEKKKTTAPLAEEKEEKGRVFWIFALVVVVILIVAYAISSSREKSKAQVEAMEKFQWDGEKFLDVNEQMEKYEENQEIFSQLEGVLDEMEEEQGQTEEESTVTKEIPVTEELMIAGEDFPVGVYDVVIKEGQGYVYYTDYSDESRTEEVIYMDHEEVSAPSRELGLSLLDGAEISMEPANEEACEIVLVPMGWR